MTDKRNFFNNLPWHDAALLDVRVDRREPGRRDELELCVRWPDGQGAVIRFTDCYRLELRMNFGVLGVDSIAGANCVADSPALDETRRRWARVADLARLHEFTLETNSTASSVSVLALDFVVLPHRL